MLNVTDLLTRPLKEKHVIRVGSWYKLHDSHFYVYGMFNNTYHVVQISENKIGTHQFEKFGALLTWEDTNLKFFLIGEKIIVPDLPKGYQVSYKNRLYEFSYRVTHTTSSELASTMIFRQIDGLKNQTVLYLPDCKVNNVPFVEYIRKNPV